MFLCDKMLLFSSVSSFCGIKLVNATSVDERGACRAKQQARISESSDVMQGEESSFDPLVYTLCAHTGCCTVQSHFLDGYTTTAVTASPLSCAYGK